MSFFSGLLKAIPGVGGVVGGLASVIQGNQTKQKNKGYIGQAYRQNAYQLGLQQANTRQDVNESMNARGVLTAGAQRGPIGTTLQQVAKSGGRAIAGRGVDPYLASAGRGAIGPANTLSGGANQQLTDQFGLEQKDLADAKTQAQNLNQAQYLNTISGAVAQAAGTAENLAGGINAWQSMGAMNKQPPSPQPGTPSPMGSSGEMAGAYGLPINPTFSSTSRSSTMIGSGEPNYLFSAGAG